MGFQVTCGLLNIATLKDRWDLTTPVIASSILMTRKFFERKAKDGRHTGVSNQSARSRCLRVESHALMQAATWEQYNSQRIVARFLDVCARALAGIHIF
jgi:hypothetical protein